MCVKKYMKICIRLFKNWKYIFKHMYQNGPTFLGWLICMETDKLAKQSIDMHGDRQISKAKRHATF